MRISEEKMWLELGPSKMTATKDKQLPPVQQGLAAGFLGEAGQEGPVLQPPDLGGLKLQAQDHMRSPAQ